MNVGSLDPRNMSNLQRALLGLAVLGLITLVGCVIAGGSAQTGRWDGIPVCGAEGEESADECLSTRSGTVERRRSGDEWRYYFDAEDGDRESLGKRRPRAATPVEGLYEDGDFVGLLGSDGERHYETSLFGGPTPYLLGAGAGLVLLVGGLLGLGLTLRRRT